MNQVKCVLALTFIHVCSFVFTLPAQWRFSLFSIDTSFREFIPVKPCALFSFSGKRSLRIKFSNRTAIKRGILLSKFDLSMSDIIKSDILLNHNITLYIAEGGF